MFTSGSPELKECLRNALGDQAFEEIAENQRPPSTEELPIIGRCTLLFGGPMGPDGGPSRPDAPGALVLWSSNQSEWTGDASLISVSFEPGSPVGRATVVGRAGAIPPGFDVIAYDVEVGIIAGANVDETGAFQTEVSALPGSHVFIGAGAGLPTPGVLIAIEPLSSMGPMNTIGASLVTAGSPVPWVLLTSLTLEDITPGEQTPFEGQVVLPFDLSTQPPDATLTLLGAQIGDSLGRQTGFGAEHVSPFLTPTGLPIEMGYMAQTFTRRISDAIRVDDWELQDGQWSADVTGAVTVPTTWKPGLYRLTAGLRMDEPVQTTFEMAGTFYCCEAPLGNITIGDRQSIRLATTLLADVIHEGARGGIRPIDAESWFDISARIATRHDPVVPRLDGLGDSWTYRLEPFLPMFGAVDRTPPAIPPMLFDFSESTLTVTVERPDGGVDTLGPAPLSHLGFRIPGPPSCFDFGIATGGHLSGMVQLQNSEGVFTYQFPSDGDYTISLSGAVPDYDGTMYEISGEYDVTVANQFKMSPAALPGTPLEIGDSLPLSVRLWPAAPAEVRFQITHAPATGPITTTTFEGVANRHGWWDGDENVFTFQEAGEYKIDLEARYEASGGHLWSGRMRMGSVTASQEPPIIAHGRRGVKGMEELPPPWFFQDEIDPGKQGHLLFPYFSGDINWGVSETRGDSALDLSTSVQILDEEHPLVAQAVEQHLSVRVTRWRGDD